MLGKRVRNFKRESSCFSRLGRECKSGATENSRIIIFIPWHANRNLYGYDSQTYVRIASTNYLSQPNHFPASFPRRVVLRINFYGTETFLADFLD